MGVTVEGMGGRNSGRIKVITLHQPWATLMAIGAKRIETRSWYTSYRGPLGIQAAKAFPKYGREFYCSTRVLRALVEGGALEIPGFEDYLADPEGVDVTAIARNVAVAIGRLPLGAILGVCDLVNCLDTELIPRYVSPFPEQELAFGNFSRGRFGWLTENMKKFETPVPVRGAQGLWEWNREEVA
jgi:activating signal cointegrator 1